MSEKQNYIDKAKARLEQWESEIEKLRAKMEEAGADAKIEYRDELDELRKHRTEAKEKLSKLAEVGDDAWDDVRHGLEAAWDRVESAFKKAKSRLG